MATIKGIHGGHLARGLDCIKVDQFYDFANPEGY